MNAQSVKTDRVGIKGNPICVDNLSNRGGRRPLMHIAEMQPKQLINVLIIP